MKTMLSILCLGAMLLTSSCTSEGADPSASIPAQPAYLTVAEDLSQIRADFNSMQEKTRLVFVIGPSCGICLRGMDDLNEAIVKHIQADHRIHTFAIHVPTLGAEERHVAASIPLMDGPRVTHYWDPGGRTGQLFQDVLNIDIYAWDIWMIYEPGSVWEEGLPPPPPVYLEHQIPGLPENLRLDADRFAAQVRQRVPQSPAKAIATPDAERDRRHAGIIPVAQPRGMMIQQNHLSRGGYRRIKKIEAIRYTGTTEIGGTVYELAVETRRPKNYRRVVGTGNAAATIAWDGSAVTREGVPPGLPSAIQDQILASFEFDGWMTDWKDKGHGITRLGMKKLGDRLPWILQAALANGQTWHIYVDSHTGDAYRVGLVDTSGREGIAMEYSDYRERDGYRLPHRVDYIEGDRLLMTDRFTSVDVELSQ